ncbi:hypothetical protein OWV82_011253 [Melia azedarach]|uniref:Uncharacterized protein n=1 Tax=Melia azedarach TaxID=155640 RepID=A0ACC1XZ20_MELAZ|nr:hypothetical protein OWV82_011253 [Melia azedarach]
MTVDAVLVEFSPGTWKIYTSWQNLLAIMQGMYIKAKLLAYHSLYQLSTFVFGKDLEVQSGDWEFTR